MTPRLLNTDMSTPSPSALYMNMQWSICLIMIKLNSTSWIGAGLNLLVKRLTDGHERMRGQTVTRHADAVDSVHAHLIRHSFNHPLGFIGCFRVRVKVQPHPPVALRLLPLQHIAWELKQKQMMLLHYILIHILSIQYTSSCFLLFFLFFFFFYQWLAALHQTEEDPTGRCRTPLPRWRLWQPREDQARLRKIHFISNICSYMAWFHCFDCLCGKQCSGLYTDDNDNWLLSVLPTTFTLISAVSSPAGFRTTTE